MRLLILASEFPPGPGGIGTHAYEIARQLVRLNWEVAVISPQDYASQEEVTQFNNSQPFPVVRLSSPPIAPLKALQRWRVKNRWVRRWRPDIILASGQRAVWLAASLPHELPWVAVGHGTEFGVAENWVGKLTRWAYGRATCVACVSQFTRQQMRAMGIRPRSEIIVPNGADDARFNVLPPHQVAAARRALNIAPGRLLMTVGNVTERKGQDVVIRALPRILEKFPDTHYLIAGLPTKKKEFQQLADELGVAGHVHFRGRVDATALAAYLNCCDVFVMTSRHTPGGDFEGYGIAVVEAALCGKPAVVSANSGLVEAIVEQQTGLAVPQEDESATAAAVISLLADDELRRRMGDDARRRAVGEQTWRRRGQEYDSLLKSLLAERAVAAVA